MLKIKLDRAQLTTSVVYHASENRGVTPVIETDHDWMEWTHWAICDLAGLDQGTDNGELLIQVDGDTVIIGGDHTVIDTVRHYLLN